MRRQTPFAVAAALVAFALPLAGQGNINLGAFVTVSAENVTDFEEAAAEHARWHGQQNDPWVWAAYSAMTGTDLQYVFLTPNHAWADFDNAPVDMGADLAHWARSGARHSESEQIVLWEGLPDVSNLPPDDTPMPIVQVFSFEVLPGGDEAVAYGMLKFKEAAGDAGTFGWARTVSSDGPPEVFIAVWANSFAELGAPGPTPPEIMTAAFGADEAGRIIDAFAGATRAISSQIWLLRPDLSHIPGN